MVFLEPENPVVASMAKPVSNLLAWEVIRAKMTTTSDILLAKPEQFDSILADIEDSMALVMYPNVSVSIDDVVLVIGMIRMISEDRDAYRKMQREVYSRFSAHATFYERTLAMLPDQLRDEISGLDNKSIREIVSKLSSNGQGTKIDPSVSTPSLQVLTVACGSARSESLSVFLRTAIPQNAFESEFKKLEAKPRERFVRAFASWDSIKRYEAHQRFNYYLKQGAADCLKQVLKDFSPTARKMINLKTDQQAIERYINRKVKAYCKSPNPESGDASGPVTMLAILFDIEYEGTVSLIISTLPNAVDDPFLVENADEFVELSHWREGLERLTSDESPIKLTLPDGSLVIVSPGKDQVLYETQLGEMLRSTMVAMHQAGKFSKLPLATDCVMWIGGPHVDYFWRENRLRRDGKIRP
jgi:hypothetical protein